MCCCDVTHCCCGAQPLDRGSLIWCAVDIVFWLIYIGLIVGAFPSDGYAGPIGWVVWNILWDILLVLAITQKIPCLMIFWQIFCIVNVVIFCIWALGLIILLAVGGFFLAIICSTEYVAYSYGYAGCDAMIAAIVGILVVMLLLCLVMPALYIYWFVVINSLRKQINQELHPTVVVPLQQPGMAVAVVNTQQQQGMVPQQQPVMYGQQQPMMQQQQPMYPA